MSKKDEALADSALDRMAENARELGLDYEPAQQEPVATVTSESENPNVSMSWWHEPALPVGTKLYTSPQSKPWVGLTDEQRDAIEQRIYCQTIQKGKTRGEYVNKVMCAIEAKLKEKNAQSSKPLTYDQIMEMYNEPRSDAEMLEFARAIEAAHGIMSVPDGKGDA